ncbi:sigma-70 family RNA polymerase sigma factor [Leifsonia shinshuensis]|uniref:Sigma-70 family RNA polymerase sigma factor n=1 Tax=Leifsonia shinshuensis TaxID=150026 RepID=A0A7G6YAH5_9MICO|nr:sigma-70 family RNA polymerase sigma factor [Leifsonia shinshuensis]
MDHCLPRARVFAAGGGDGGLALAAGGFLPPEWLIPLEWPREARPVKERAHRDTSGTAELFTDAYRTHAASLLAYLRSQGVDDPEAVTQDVFVALYPRLESLSGGQDGLRALLFTIAHARVVDHHRRRSRVPAAVAYDPIADTRSTPSAEDDVVRGATGVAELLGRLTPEYREVIALRILAELTIEEVAQIMGRTPGAIKQLQRRALIALRREVAGDEERAAVAGAPIHEREGAR